ncbi:hypothetical protein JTE90_026405 [Oedothorax gibbosus]|uniref:Uncharacterized protein n=1 Tax=Oedothorax gibbosus TaxID=931172 RepID=A0AAV6VFP2_9ARAC|nr:hypothetical protein JTE90_026405 [Oedothorax gibbosus]
MARGSRTPYSSLLHTYVQQTTTHGIRKIASSHPRGRRAFWALVFMISLSVCIYHCSYLIGNFLTNPKVTITQEKDADYVQFPSLTVCNLNVIKQDFVRKYFKLTSETNAAKKSTKTTFKLGNSSTVCYQSEEELLRQSAVDLSDTWLYLGVTKDNLSDHGHKYEDLIVQCTYNSNDCNDNTTAFMVVKSSVTSPIFGLCHTIAIQNRRTKKPSVIKKGGTTQGLRLTLNIERAEYWDLISSEYGVRLMVHPQGTYPTLQRGGIIASPGRSVHIGVKRKVTVLLPGREGSCSGTFSDSQIVPRLKKLDLDFDLDQVKYTYEHCNTLCQNTLLFEKCSCLDEQPRIAPGNKTPKWKFCNPCNREEAKCRSEVLKNFNDMPDECDVICKPSCNSVRYDISLSKADWPNLDHQQFVMNRSFEAWQGIPEAMGLLRGFFADDAINATAFVNDTFFKENLLRVHLFVEEMTYMSVEEKYSYTLPKLLADLGGCLGLYLGVSVISIMEFVDLCGSWSVLCLLRRSPFSSNSTQQRRTSTRKRRKNRREGSSAFRASIAHYLRKNNEVEDDTWRNSVLSPRDLQYYTEDIPRKQVIRRF